MKKYFLFLFIIIMFTSCDSSYNPQTKEDTLSVSKVGNSEKIKDSNSDEFISLTENLKSNNNFSTFMIKEITKSLENDKLDIIYGDVDTSIDNDYYKISVDSTDVILDKNTNLIKMQWIVSEKGKRGNGYKREPNMPKGMEKGHIKSIQEGAKDNSIEDSPLNIIPQTPVVNDPNIKEFEKYRVNNCKGEQVITTIISDKKVLVEIPAKKIKVTYNPLSKNEWDDQWWFKSNVN